MEDSARERVHRFSKNDSFSTDLLRGQELWRAHLLM